MYRIIAFDGVQPPIVLDLTREELSSMVRATIISSISVVICN